MRLNHEKFQSNVQRFLASPAAEPFWEEAENSVWLNIVSSLIMLVIGLILVCTIIFAKIGFLLVWGILKSFLTLDVFRDQRKKLKSEPERLVPLLAAGIIIGPQGHGLVLGSFSRTTQEDLPFLGRAAQTLGGLYVDGSMSDSDQEVMSILRSDAYVSGRRRAVPASHSAGRDLVMFDMKLDIDDAKLIDGVVWVACVAKNESPRDEFDAPHGSLYQIPWTVAASAVH